MQQNVVKQDEVVEQEDNDRGKETKLQFINDCRPGTKTIDKEAKVKLAVFLISILFLASTWVIETHVKKMTLKCRSRKSWFLVQSSCWADTDTVSGDSIRTGIG